MQALRPLGPILVFLRVGADPAANQQKNRSNDEGEYALVFRYEVLGRSVLCEFSKERAQSKICAECFWSFSVSSCGSREWGRSGRPTRTGQVSNIKEPIKDQEDMHQYAVFETHPNRRRQDDVDLERANQQRTHRPLMSVERVIRARPRREERLEEAPQILPEGPVIGGVEANPEAVAVVRSCVSPEARQHEADKCRNHGGQHQSRRAAKGAPGNRLKRRWVVAMLVGKLQGLIRAYEARQEGKYGNADAPLVRNSQVWELE